MRTESFFFSPSPFPPFSPLLLSALFYPFSEEQDDFSSPFSTRERFVLPLPLEGLVFSLSRMSCLLPSSPLLLRRREESFSFLPPPSSDDGAKIILFFPHSEKKRLFLPPFGKRSPHFMRKSILPFWGMSPLPLFCAGL